MATRQQEMEEFLSAIVQGKTFVWTAKFWGSTIDLRLVGEEDVKARVDLEKYPCHVRKDFIKKLRLANISTLAMESITVYDYTFQRNLRGNSAKLPDGHATLTEDIAEIIKALQSTPTTEEPNVVGDGESQSEQAEGNLMEASVSSTHQIQLNTRTLTNIRILSDLQPQKLKAVCSLIVSPGSKVKSVKIIPAFNSSQGGTLPLQCRVLEEMLSAQKGGSSPALESFIFDVRLMWNRTSVERLGEFLQRTPSIKEIVFKSSNEDYQDMCIEGSLAENLAEALCLNNQVHILRFEGPCRHLQEAVMRVLTSNSQGQHPITALNCLHLAYAKRQGDYYATGDWIESCLFEFINKAKCLNALQITTCRRALPLKVVEALKSNHGLEQFTWRGDPGSDADEDAIFSTIMDALRVNYQLKGFVYPWKNNYYEEALILLFEERAINKPWEVMKDMVLVPSTSARLFFCGYPYAGEFLWLVYVLSCMHAICEILTNQTSFIKKIKAYA